MTVGNYRRWITLALISHAASEHRNLITSATSSGRVERSPSGVVGAEICFDRDRTAARRLDV